MTVRSTTQQATSSLISPEVPENILVEYSSADRPLKLGVMASASGTNFEVIAQAIVDKKLNAKIQVLICNNPNALVLNRAKKFGISTIIHNHRQYQNREELDHQIVQTLQENQVEWVIMAGWMRVITQVLIDAFPHKIINIHPSLLPSFPGIRSIEQALAAKVKITGCTAHFVTLEVDSGPIIMQAAVPILPDDTPETLHARIQEQEHKILPQAIILAAAQKIE